MQVAHLRGFSLWVSFRVFGESEFIFGVFVPFMGFDLLVFRNQRKVGVFLQGFELVGSGVFTAGVAEDFGKP